MLRKSLILVSLGVLITGCSTNEMDQLTEYMVDNERDLPAMLEGWTIDAQTLFDGGAENYFILDIRQADKYTPNVNDFEEGHIPGAHSVAQADVVAYEAEYNTDGLPVVVVCYTGQQAGHATMALRLHGVEAKTLLFGMSSWNSDFDLWTPNLGDKALDYPSAWVDTAAPTIPEFDLPVLDTGLKEGVEIFDAQVKAMALDKFSSITIDEVLGSPEDYYVVNYWGSEDYDNYGHIEGAYQITPGELTIDTLSMIDPDSTVVVYCWTGQTASMVTAWLNVLGYDAKALLFSANGMIYDDLEAHKFTGSMDYAYATGS